MARIKSPDMPGFIKPQLATLRAKAPAGDQWLHEIKFDMVQATASSTGRHKFRPDIVVRSGPPSNNTFITDPVVVVEVLSPSTMDRDRGRKLQFYKELPTAAHRADLCRPDAGRALFPDREWMGLPSRRR
jgi:Putative restriction endonuclease